MVQLHERIVENIKKVIKGKDEKIKLVLAEMYAGGHVLLEDVPGVGKTVLARSIAVSLGFDFKRVQFTPDLLPTDLTGLSIYDRKSENFVFKEGPLFTNILLADEINRATPRTQSALLEAMAERQVTVDGITRKLSNNFFVIATQNPIEYE
ncbi:MAG TPA: AAA family ATPase, partial [Fervidobacterium sp.]|nr:AAA family ATPase [Fervidobacterium sp.]